MELYFFLSNEKNNDYFTNYVIVISYQVNMSDTFIFWFLRCFYICEFVRLYISQTYLFKEL